MKIEKIFNEIIRDIVNLNPIRYRIAFDAESVSIFNGSVLYKIPLKKWLLDFDKLNMKQSGNPLASFNERDFERGILTGNIKRHKDNKTNKMLNFVEFKNQSDELIYVNEAFLKYFDGDCFNVKGVHDPVLIYENGDMAGVVMPYIIK